MSEHSEQVALFDALAYHPELQWAFAIPNGGFRDKRTAANLRREGVRAGVWDLCVPYARQGYHGLFIEMKFGINKLTKEQLAFGDAMKEQGYLCRVAYGWKTAYDIIMGYMGLEAKFE